MHQGKRFKHTSGETPEQFEEERMLSTVRMWGAASIFMWGVATKTRIKGFIWTQSSRNEKLTPLLLAGFRETVIVVGYYLITIQPPGGNSRCFVAFGGATHGVRAPVVVYSPIGNLCSRSLSDSSLVHVCKQISQITNEKLNGCSSMTADGFQDYVSCLPACNHNLLKHDWSIQLGLQTYNRRSW